MSIQSGQHFTVIIEEGESYDCRSDMTLLGSMELARSSNVNVGCRGGGCGVCKVQLISGHVYSKPMSKAHISESEFDQGYRLACRIYPQSDLVIAVPSKKKIRGSEYA